MIPKVPPAAIMPADRPASYPPRRISGRAIWVMVAVVATDDPLIAAKPAHEKTEANAKPPLK